MNKSRVSAYWILSVLMLTGPGAFALAGEVNETEPNDIYTAANPLAQGEFGRGSVTYTFLAAFWIPDGDYWKSPAQVGDLVFAYMDTHESSAAPPGSIQLYANDGATLIESDSSDGPPGPSVGAVIAGAVATQAGNVFYMVNGAIAFSSTEISPYRLYQAVVHPSETAAEIEPNDTPATANGLSGRMITGNVSGTDVDFYKVFLRAGQRLAVIMDDNPDNDATNTDTELSILGTDGATTLATGNNVGSGVIPGIGDGNAAGAIIAPSTGVYFIRVAHGGEAGALDTDYRFVALIDGGTVVDSDADGVPDDVDGCPNDSNKSAPGICGCGLSDVDTDGDGTADCNDGCPNDPAKTAPGQCGCGFAETTNCSGGSASGSGSASCGTCGNGAATMMMAAALLMSGMCRRAREWSRTR